MATEEQIKSVAYAIWEQQGRPEGKHLEHYLRAKQILEGSEAIRPIELAPPPQVAELASPPPVIGLPPSPPIPELGPPTKKPKRVTRRKKK
jgi:hypothetical protein